MRIKEFLTVRGIDFQSVNVLEEDGMAQLNALGARTLPVVSRGDKYVFAQIIKDVVEFLDLDEDTAPKLTPAQLASRYDGILTTAIRLVKQMPDDCHSRELPNRPRSWRVLMHHVFQIPTAFLDMEDTGDTMTYENMTAPPPENLTNSAAVAAFGEAVRQRFNMWWQNAQSKDFDEAVPVYFGRSTRHEMLERVVWHSTQHTRQVASLLEQAQVTPDSPLAKADWDGLPLTEVVWDT